MSDEMENIEYVRACLRLAQAIRKLFPSRTNTWCYLWAAAIMNADRNGGLSP